jgi:hypothetical protein
VSTRLDAAREDSALLFNLFAGGMVVRTLCGVMSVVAFHGSTPVASSLLEN